MPFVLVSHRGLHVIVGPNIIPPELDHRTQGQFSTARATHSPMPPWVASVPRSTTCLRRIVIDRLSPSLRCRDVSASNLRIRSASTHVSPTAINYRPNIPPRNEELYNALSALSGAAERFVNLSRLQLALRGLAAENAVTRVAGMADTRLRHNALG